MISKFEKAMVGSEELRSEEEIEQLMYDVILFRISTGSAVSVAIWRPDVN